MTASGDAAALDYKSLTLPDIYTALKKKVKRPKKRDYLWLLLSVWNGVYGVLDILAHRYGLAARDIILCTIYYKIYLAQDNWEAKFRWIMVMLCFSVASIVWVL